MVWQSSKTELQKLLTFRSWKRYCTIGIPPVSGLLQDTSNSYKDVPNGSDIITSGLGAPELDKLNIFRVLLSNSMNQETQTVY